MTFFLQVLPIIQRKLLDGAAGTEDEAVRVVLQRLASDLVADRSDAGKLRSPECPEIDLFGGQADPVSDGAEVGRL